MDAKEISDSTLESVTPADNDLMLIYDTSEGTTGKATIADIAPKVAENIDIATLPAVTPVADDVLMIRNTSEGTTGKATIADIFSSVGNTSGITESSALSVIGTAANATQHDINVAVNDVIASKVGTRRYVGDFTIAANSQRTIRFSSDGSVFMNLFFEGHNGASCGGVMLSGYNELEGGRMRGIYYVGSPSDVIVNTTNYGIIIAAPSIATEVHYEITSTNKPSIETAQSITISSWSDLLYQVANS